MPSLRRHPTRIRCHVKDAIRNMQSAVCRLVVCGLAGAAACVWAADDSGAALPEPAAPPDELRDPFWPIDYRPPRPAAPGAPAPDQPDAETPEELPPDTAARAEAMAALKVGGIIRRGRVFFASVNGQMVQAGDVIAVPHAGRFYRFRIYAIDMRKVRIEPVD